MDKRIERTENNLISHGIHSEILDFSQGKGLAKIAKNSYIPQHLEKTIREIEAAPDKNMVYLYDRALGAGEVYGPNNNGDWFGESELQRKHDTFVKEGKLFRNHVVNPANSTGDVLASAYNDKLDTVDLVIRAPLTNLSGDLEKLASGMALGTSMGARVTHDICSICGNKSQTRSAYCDHLKYKMLKIFDDGRQVFAINPDPRFVDISLVIVPAAPESLILRKIASQNMVKKAFILEKTEERGVINPGIIEATKMIKRADLIATLHTSKGLLRPDEFDAIMNKDASLIRNDIVPYINYGRTNISMEGSALNKLAKYISGISNINLTTTAKQEHYSAIHKNAYLEYRNWSKDNTRLYLR